MEKTAIRIRGSRCILDGFTPIKRRGWIGFRICGFALKSARNVDFSRINQADSRILNRGSAVNFGAVSGLSTSSGLILGQKRNLDHRSFFSLGRYVNEFIQCQWVHFIACYFLHYLCEITSNSGIHIYLSDLNKTLEDWQIWWEKGTDRRICIPLFILLPNLPIVCREYVPLIVYWPLQFPWYGIN